MDMPRVTLGLGLALIVLGLGGYFVPEKQSATALIPAYVGAVFVVLGVVAMKDSLRKHAMHVAAALGLLGFLAGGMGLVKLPTLLTGGEVARPNAVVLQSAMAVLCAIYVGLCVRSFVLARRKGEQGARG